MFCLVCFDIVEDRARNRVAKILKEYGQRVQKSVFECSELNEKKFLRLKNRLEDCIDSAEDTVRYYFICRDCLQKVELTGVGELPITTKFMVV